MSDNDDFFKNQEQITNEEEDEDELLEEYENINVDTMNDIKDQFKKYYNIEESGKYNMEEEESGEDEEENSNPNGSSNPFMGDYTQFMNQSSSDYLMYSTMDLMKTMNIFRELRTLMTNLGDWDRIILFYAYELMQRNMQVCYKLGLYLYKNRDEDVIPQMIYWGIMLFCMANVQTAYSYIIYRIYKLDKDFACRLHEHMKEQFMFFDDHKDMAGSFNDNIINRLDVRNPS
jgi:hypothetical protein